ncbi:hypothetical protein D6821_00455 [Candidatus Parcubacteria bacterium]|nr:MAG: hypothetical protein D6821_00455 [Candidatus Parcubacteria bacterium]
MARDAAISKRLKEPADFVIPKPYYIDRYGKRHELDWRLVALRGAQRRSNTGNSAPPTGFYRFASE